MTIEGELLPFHQQELKVGGDGEEDRIFFIWPTTIVHKITPGSPLYMLSAADFLQEKFEIVVVLEGEDHILFLFQTKSFKTVSLRRISIVFGSSNTN